MLSNTLRFDGKVALITGAGGGLGRAYATMLASRGCRVVVNELSVAAGQRVVDEIVADAGVAVLSSHDVAREAVALIEDVEQRFGQLDIVINNAGTTNGGPFADIPAADFDKVLAVHLGGTVSVCRAAWPLLARGGNGKIINTSSGSIFGFPFASAYVTAKAAVMGLSRTLAAEGRLQGIAVNSILPSAYTPMSDQIPDETFRHFIRDFFSAEDVAAFVVWLAHEDCTLTGEAWSVGGGRAARVALASAAGAMAGGDGPEAWRGREAELMDQQPVHVPASSLDEVAYQASEIGGAAAEAMQHVPLRDWGGRSR